MRSKPINYELVGAREDGQYIFKFIDEGFDDVHLCIYGVEFLEEGDEAHMKFDYDIHEGTIEADKFEEFKTLMGDFLIQAIEEGIKKNEITYTGGVDENRDNDSEQFGV